MTILISEEHKYKNCLANKQCQSLYLNKCKTRGGGKSVVFNYIMSYRNGGKEDKCVTCSVCNDKHWFTRALIIAPNALFLASNNLLHKNRSKDNSHSLFEVVVNVMH